MPDIFHDLPIKAPLDQVFEAVSTPQGLDSWWTKRSSGTPSPGADYELYFGPEYDWRAKVTRCELNSDFELQISHANADWDGTYVGHQLERKGDTTWLNFHHTGWPKLNSHFRISCNCWAMYLRILRRHLEHGESVPYEDRLNA